MATSPGGTTAQEARDQGSLWMQMRLILLMCALPDADKRDLAELKAIYDRLTEGFSTVLVTRARELIQKGQVPAPDPLLRPTRRGNE